MVLSRGLAALGADAGAIRLLSEDGADLVRLGIEGYPGDMLAAVAERLPMASPSPLCAAVRTGRPVFLADAAAYARRFPAFAARPAASGYRAAAALPLIVDGRVLGGLALSYVGPRRFDRPHRAYAATLADLAAQALDRARLYEAERGRAEAAEAMAAMGSALGAALEPERLYEAILEQVTRVVPCDHASVVMYDGGHLTFVATRGEPRVAPGTSFPPGALWLPDERRAPVYVPDAPELPGWVAVPPLTGALDTRSLIAVPLRIDGRIVGSFDVGSRTPRFYTPDHLRLVARFAEHVTLALRNARLYAAERERAAAAQELARLRSEFVATVSHEMRTPLTAIVGFGELLEARWDATGDAQRRETVGKMVGSARRQQRLVEDLLLLSRLEGRALEVRRAPVPVGPLVGRASEEVRLSYPGQGVDLSGPPGLLVLAAADQAVQVLANLIDNAAKYSPEGSPVAAGWRPEGEWAAIRVRDWGTGIPDAHRNVLFTRFGRVPGSRIRAGHVGTGLGLYLSRQLAEAMGGTLDLESTGPQGSTFTLRLPLAADAPAG